MTGHGDGYGYPPVRVAGDADYVLLPALEDAADRVFGDIGVGPLPPVAEVVGLSGVLVGGPSDVASGALGGVLVVLVVGDPPVGFARLDQVDDAAHLEQLSVHPDHGRRGVGAQLLAAACEWAAEHSYGAMTLCTFADVPWNGPFYARHGFATVAEADLTPGLRELRRREVGLGLDALGRRIVMRKTLAGPRS